MGTKSESALRGMRARQNKVQLGSGGDENEVDQSPRWDTQSAHSVQRHEMKFKKLRSRDLRTGE